MRRCGPPYDRAIWAQREIQLQAHPRGIHLITDEVLGELPEIRELRVGLLNLLLQHTSASLALNENASPAVRADVRTWLDHAVPEDAPYWTHTLEGPDDMPSHMKTILTGSTLSLPIAGGSLALGTWQGIYLCEHRDSGGARRLLVTAFGEPSESSANIRSSDALG
jgi:secondary thiamine-phosphate synthase enzyme